MGRLSGCIPWCRWGSLSRVPSLVDFQDFRFPEVPTTLSTPKRCTFVWSLWTCRETHLVSTTTGLATQSPQDYSQLGQMRTNEKFLHMRSAQLWRAGRCPGSTCRTATALALHWPSVYGYTTKRSVGKLSPEKSNTRTLYNTFLFFRASPKWCVSRQVTVALTLPEAKQGSVDGTLPPRPQSAE